MAKRPTGEVIERERKNGRVFALRFRAYGRRHFVTLGGTGDGWTRQKAEVELRHVLADVERGLWAPGVAHAAEAPAAPTFHEFASEWLEARRGELKETTLADYTWQLCNHLLPFFHRHHLSQITVAEVDRYRALKVREQVLSAESINKTITRLGQILAVAEERDLIPRNPVRVNTRNRKLKAKRKRPVYLESAEQIIAMIDAASELDAKSQGAHGRTPEPRPKRASGLVDILPALRDELLSHRHANANAALERAGVPDVVGQPPRQGQRPRARDPAGRRARRGAARQTRPRPAAGRRDGAQAAPHVRLDPVRARGGPALRDGPARPHRCGLHAPRLRPRDAPR